MAEPDTRVRAEIAKVARAVTATAPNVVIGIYAHGSAVLGDFRPGVSDLDLLVVVDDAASVDEIEAISNAIAATTTTVAIGVEASVVNRLDAARARPPWTFRSHVTTAPTDRKIVDGRNHPGDPDLALHYAVTRHAGWVASGPQPEDIIGEPDRDLMLKHLAAELRWAAAEAPTTYAVLNACRALRYRADGSICSKTDGGRWASEHHLAPHATAALAHRAGSGPPPADDARGWVLSVADNL